MNININKTVAELASEIPGAASVFEASGIDYCCGGAKTLGDACMSAGVDPQEIDRRLKEAHNEPAEAGETSWTGKRLADLAAHIVSTHHLFTKNELKRLAGLIDKVCSKHGENHPELLQIRSVFQGLDRELTPHMLKEEQVLFPYIKLMEEAVERNEPIPPPFFGTVQNPVRMMMIEHDSAGDALRTIREASGGFLVPEDGCASYRALYEGLKALEEDLHRHIHLENNILFPKAVRMESNH